MQEYDQIIEKAVLVGVIRRGETVERAKEFLDELEFLAFTAGAEVIGRFTQKLAMPNHRTFVGPGKLLEIKTFIDEKKPQMVIFDDELSGSQLRNIEKELEIKVLDRTNVILDIFAKRAKTAQSKAQVELAQYQYMLPRLTRLWTHLERQRGGIGLRGPGETEIETDRRIVREKIAILKKKLDSIDVQNTIQRKSRGQKVRVSLVGYTNAGKSTIMNLLSKSDVFAEDKLFATLDTTVRNVVFNNITFLLSDTVGFIRKLPHRLVESFKSTLDEVREADILLHIVDISHPEYEHHLKTVEDTLVDIKAADKLVLLVYNKIDKLEKDADNESDNYITELIGSKSSLNHPEKMKTIFISAKEKQNIEEFKSAILKMVIETYKKVYPHYPISVTE